MTHRTIRDWRRGWRLGLLAAWAALAATAHAAPIESFDDIQFWVGEGANRSAVVIDWHESAGQGEPLAWGYRWDGQATGAQMLLAVVAADERLFAKLRVDEQAMYGLGYDRVAPIDFAISDASLFDERGVTHASVNQADGALAVDPADSYGEGWFDAFWHYATEPGGLGSGWESSQVGYASRELTDGAVDGWTWAAPFNFLAFPDPAEAAPASVAGGPGDFNQDGAVDAADYTVWRDGLASDAYTGHDYFLWRDHYGGAAASAAGVAPEPVSLSLLAAGLALSAAACRRCHLCH